MIPEVAISVKALPMPVVMDVGAGHRIDDRRGTAPRIIIGFGKRIRDRIGTERSDRLPTFVTKTTDQIHFTEFSIGDILECAL